MNIYEIDEMIEEVQNSMKVKSVELKVNILNDKVYYIDRLSAELFRERGERIYYEPSLGYYIVRPHRKDSWSLF